MTNEELAVLIQQGGHDELIPELWNRVSRLLELKAIKYYEYLSKQFLERGITLDDLTQEMYFAFLKAIKYFDDNSGYKFVTYLEAPVKAHISRLTEKKSVTRCISLDSKAYDNDTALLSEVIADELSDVEKEVMADITKEVLDAEIKKLPLQRRRVIRLYYYNYRTDTDIAESMKTTPSNIYRIRHEALADLRRSYNVQSVYYSVVR